MGIYDRIENKHAAVLLIDLQVKLLPAMREPEECVIACSRLIQGARVLRVPLVATEQYPAGLGRTDARISALLGGVAPVEKMQFSAWTPEVEAALGERFHVILAGIEAHVCVQQTALDLLKAGKRVWLCADACSSRHKDDFKLAMERMRQAGVVVTSVESVLFELLGQAGSEEFKQILKIVK